MRARAPSGVMVVMGGLLLGACAPVPAAPRGATGLAPDSGELGRDRSDPAGSADASIPAGYGSLRQDELSMEIVDMDLHMKVTPLTEDVIRLAAPDTYERLHALSRSRSAEAEGATEEEGAALFLVSFFSREPNVEYNPEELVLAHRGRALRPVTILPLTTGWGRQLLQPQQTQSAIYVFEPAFDYELPITLRYRLRQSDGWHRQVLPRLEQERARVLSRAGGSP